MKTEISFDSWLESAAKKLKKAGITSAHLDALIILEDATHLSRATILAHPDYVIDHKLLDGLEIALIRRSKREPLAYIRGFSEFWKHKYIVSKDVMIPRPASESFLEMLLDIKPHEKQNLLDVGTGSGALAISAKLQFPFLEVWASDISCTAIDIAQNNSYVLGAEINFVQSDLLELIDSKFDYIFANLPYVPHKYPVSKEVNFEPQSAIYAADHGMQLIKKLASQVTNYMNKDGCLFVESLVEQQNDIKDFLKEVGFSFITKDNLVQLFKL